MSSRSTQPPSDAKPLVNLDNWALVHTGDPYASPESQRARLQGIPVDHPRLGSGRNIITSPIVKTDPENEIVETHNTRYKLGEANPEYEAVHPNAKARLFALS